MALWGQISRLLVGRLNSDHNLESNYPIYMFTDKLGGIELPHPPNIEIEENPKLFAVYAIPENKIKTIQVFLYYLTQKE